MSRHPISRREGWVLETIGARGRQGLTEGALVAFGIKVGEVNRLAQRGFLEKQTRAATTAYVITNEGIGRITPI